MYSKSALIRSYKKETNFKVKERLLLVIKVEHDNVIPVYAADELHRSRPWALYWLDRFSLQKEYRWIKKQTKEWVKWSDQIFAIPSFDYSKLPEVKEHIERNLHNQHIYSISFLPFFISFSIS